MKWKNLVFLLMPMLLTAQTDDYLFASEEANGSLKVVSSTMIEDFSEHLNAIHSDATPEERRDAILKALEKKGIQDRHIPHNYNFSAISMAETDFTTQRNLSYSDRVNLQKLHLTQMGIVEVLRVSSPANAEEQRNIILNWIETNPDTLPTKKSPTYSDNGQDFDLNPSPSEAHLLLSNDPEVRRDTLLIIVERQSKNNPPK